ncbi:uncharacterized protein UBRO2_01685 [Ustilago bromivora]|uniref:Uncharacterized protein n=1 Tax=Ustilago bromivora TaxID=307758 RepID=A0A8H8QJT2_9BASI|nr:uncharacterized protein UBRO2_01685 [Ustilago bromivora]
MIFDGIDIDLHFVFEGKLDSPNVSHIFNNYRHAALQHRPGNHTVVGAFLGQDSPQDDQIVVRALHEGSPGQNAEILFESRPTMMPSGKQFEWVDAGLIYEFPPCDISVTVKRPSIQQTLTAIFKNVNPTTSPVLDAAFNPRQVIAGGDDERRLNQFIQAFIEGTAAQRDDIIRCNFNASSPAPTVAPGQDQTNSAEENVNVSETDVVNHENPGTLVKVITTLLDDVTPPMEENHYVDTSNQTDSEDEGSKKGEEAKACRTVGEGVRIDGTGAVLVERDAQTEQSGGQTQVIGVSCPGQVTEGDAHGQASDAMQPLVLSVGSGFPPQESIHSTDVEVPSDPAAVAAAQALSIGQTTVGVDRVGNDIEMTDVQAASSKPTSASTHGDDQASAQLQVGVPDSDIQAQGTAQAPVAIDRDKENERPTQDNATAAPVATDDNVQFFSLSRAEEQNGHICGDWNQRLHQLLDYLLNLVQNDKMQGNLLCKRLLAMREEFAQEFEQAKKQFEARLAHNNEAIIKVNDLNDLLRPMPIRHKHSGSQVGSIRGVAHAGTPAAAQAGCPHANTPRLPLAPGSFPSSPVVIDGETTQHQRTPSTRAGSTVGRDRSARAGSVPSAASSPHFSPLTCAHVHGS